MYSCFFPPSKFRQKVEEITQDFLESYAFSKLVPKIARYCKRDFFAYGNLGFFFPITRYFSQNFVMYSYSSNTLLLNITCTNRNIFENSYLLAFPDFLLWEYRIANSNNKSFDLEVAILYSQGRKSRKCFTN